MRFIWIAVLALVALSPVLAEPADPEDVARLLGSDDPAVRSRAEHDLLHMGARAQAALMGAAESKDPEVAAKAKEILEDLVWPDAGQVAGGLQLALRAEKSYAAHTSPCLRVRLLNTTDKDITVAGAHTPEPSESDVFLMALDGDPEGDLHMCFRSAHPLPGLAEKFTVPAHEWVEFQVYPENWCAQQDHSKCCPVQLAPGSHRLKIALNLPKAPEGAWTGRVDSNEVKFKLEK